MRTINVPPMSTFHDAAPGTLLLGWTPNSEPVLGLKAIDGSNDEWFVDLKVYSSDEVTPPILNADIRGRCFNLSSTYALMPSRDPRTFANLIDNRDIPGALFLARESTFLGALRPDPRGGGASVYVNLDSGVVLAKLPDGNPLIVRAWSIVTELNDGSYESICSFPASKTG